MILSNEQHERANKIWFKIKDIGQDQLDCEHDYSSPDDAEFCYDVSGECKLCGINNGDDPEDESDEYLHFLDGFSYGRADGITSEREKIKVLFEALEKRQSHTFYCDYPIISEQGCPACEALAIYKEMN